MSELTALAWPAVVLIIALLLLRPLNRKVREDFLTRMNRLESAVTKLNETSYAPAAALDTANRALSVANARAREVDSLVKAVEALNLRSAQDNAGIESAIARIQKLEMARMTRMG